MKNKWEEKKQKYVSCCTMIERGGMARLKLRMWKLGELRRGVEMGNVPCAGQKRVDRNEEMERETSEQ
jgi:hypothetical protein